MAHVDAGECQYKAADVQALLLGRAAGMHFRDEDASADRDRVAHRPIPSGPKLEAGGGLIWTDWSRSRRLRRSLRRRRSRSLRRRRWQAPERSRRWEVRSRRWQAPERSLFCA